MEHGFMSVAERPLILGLGNPMAGDDGVGSHIARRLHEDPRVPPEADVIEGGTDLLRLAHELEGRPWVILVDAILDPGPPGTLLRFDGGFEELDARGGGVHHLSPIEALCLLRCLYPPLRAVPMTFLAITIQDVRISHELSPALAQRLDRLVDGVLETLAGSPEGAPSADTG
jgi:hydrogenase maturation protease